MHATASKLPVRNSFVVSDWDNTLLSREFCVWAALASAVFIVGVTEILGFFHALDRPRLLVFWALGLTGILAWSRLKRRKAAVNEFGGWIWQIWGGTLLERITVIGLVVLGFVTFLTAVIAPPNTWDSMTYHMSRAANWEQNRSVDVYPTNIGRQLALAPFAEYVILHLQILFNSDRAANLVQWGAMMASALIGSMIAGRLGAGGLGQRLGAVATLTVPSGILQATGTYNDYVVALWLSALAYFVLRFHQVQDWASVVGIALSAGLAIFTKGTAFIYGCSFGTAAVLILVWHWRQKGLSALALIAIVVLLINGPFLLRCHRIYDVWLYSEKVEGADLQNNVLHPASFASVILRNLAMHVPTSIRGSLQRNFEAGHRAVGLDLNDPRTTFGPGFRFERHMLDETLGQNPLHLVLLFLATAWAFRWGRAPGMTLIRAYALCGMAGFFLFCLLLKWQKYNIRLQLPLFVLAGPLVGLWISGLRQRSWQFVVASLMLLFAVGPAFANDSRPWVGKNSIWAQSREDLYFIQCPAGLQSRYHIDYQNTCQTLKEMEPRRIGLCLNMDDWEYPARVLVSSFENPSRCTWQHVLVRNGSSSLSSNPPWDDFVPDYVLSTRNGEGMGLQVGPSAYNQILSNSVFRVYEIVNEAQDSGP